MTRELSSNHHGEAHESGAAVLSLFPELSRPGEEVRVSVTLPDSVPKHWSRFVILVRQFDSGKTVLTRECTRGALEGPGAEVLLELPANLDLGYYTLSLRGPRKQEIASEALIVIDSVSLARFDWADKALQYMIDAARAKDAGDPFRAMLMLGKAADHYSRADSPQCAGAALVDAAEAAAAVEGGREKFEGFGWAAVKFLLVAGDAEGACHMTRRLVDSAGSISDAVSLYVESARAALAAQSFATEIKHRQRTILNVAERSLPPPSEEGILERILAAMRKSQKNQYVTARDELIYLVTKEIAVYSPGVLFNTPRGPIIHCTTFISSLGEMSHEFAVAAMAAR